MFITDYYGGCVLITGCFVLDTICGGSYKSFKAKRITRGDWSSDNGSSNGKIESIKISKDASVYVKIGAYTNIQLSNLSTSSFTYVVNATLPSSGTRDITIQ